MTVLIIPGLHGSERAHWQSRWQALLMNAERVEQADWSVPDRDTWLSTLAGHVDRRPGAYLVGHSLGATLIGYLSSAYPDLAVGGALLVAPVDPVHCGDRLPGSASFGPLPLRPLHFPAILVASRNDPFIAQPRARAIADRWKATFIDAGNAGHINVASGHGPWPEGLRLLDQLRDHRGRVSPMRPSYPLRPSPTRRSQRVQ